MAGWRKSAIEVEIDKVLTALQETDVKTEQYKMLTEELMHLFIALQMDNNQFGCFNLHKLQKVIQYDNDGGIVTTKK